MKPGSIPPRLAPRFASRLARFFGRLFGRLFLFAALACDSQAIAREAPVFSRLDSLFLAAATGAPRLQPLRDSCEKELVSGGRATLEYLAARRFGGQTPRQQHYVERLFVLIGDSGRVAASRETLAAALSRAAPDSVRALMLYVGSALGDTAFRAVALRDLGSSSAAVRRMALRSLGQYPHPDNAALLRAALPASRDLERQQILWALGRQKEPEPLSFWAARLDEARYYNRRTARDRLLRGADSAWSALAPLMPADPSPRARREWRLLAREARGGEVWLRSEAKRMTKEERLFFGIRN